MSALRQCGFIVVLFYPVVPTREVIVCNICITSVWLHCCFVLSCCTNSRSDCLEFLHYVSVASLLFCSILLWQLEKLLSGISALRQCGFIVVLFYPVVATLEVIVWYVCIMSVWLHCCFVLSCCSNSISYCLECLHYVSVALLLFCSILL